jgi:hypothetical protein
MMYECMRKGPNRGKEGMSHVTNEDADQAREKEVHVR